MKILLLSALFLTSNAWSMTGDVSGNVEAQTRKSWNNPEAKDELFQDWDEEQFSLLYGNLNGKLELDGGSRFEANWFVRHSYSDLYQPENNPVMGDDPYLATRIFTFPNDLVARDVFKLQYRKQENKYLTESVLNKFYYEWSYDEHRFTVGRMYINYGLGEIFNPINPFNQPTGLTSISQVAQGNDGLNFTFFVNEKYTLNFYLLGDKKIENYEGQIDRTLWVHGEYQATEELQLDFIAGEDQNRHKLGGQVAYRFSEAMVFAQGLYRSHFVNHKESQTLVDLMLGYDQQMTSKWHVRFEGGYQEKDDFALPGSFGDRFLPTEYFVALANVYEIHPLLKLGGTLINDVKSGFTYLVVRNTYSLSDNVEAELFGYVPVGKGDAADNVAQKLVTTDVGLALRAFF
jgi:hypothetical protein